LSDDTGSNGWRCSDWRPEHLFSGWAAVKTLPINGELNPVKSCGNAFTNSFVIAIDPDVSVNITAGVELCRVNYLLQVNIHQYWGVLFPGRSIDDEVTMVLRYEVVLRISISVVYRGLNYRRGISTPFSLFLHLYSREKCRYSGVVFRHHKRGTKLQLTTLLYSSGSE